MQVSFVESWATAKRRSHGSPKGPGMPAWTLLMSTEISIIQRRMHLIFDMHSQARKYFCTCCLAITEMQQIHETESIKSIKSQGERLESAANSTSSSTPHQTTTGPHADKIGDATNQIRHLLRECRKWKD